MLLAEKKTRKMKTTSWSPTFGKAIAHKSLWKIALSLKINHKYPNEDFVHWAISLGVNDIRSMDIATIKRNYRMAQKELREIERSAENLREIHLRSMLTEAELSGDDQKIQKRLQVLIRAHERKQHFQRLKNVFKPQATGGLSYILVPQNFTTEDYPYEPETIDKWEIVHDQEELQDYIQKRNIQHFGQAHGTPFTEHPLKQLKWQADTIKANEIITGCIPLSLITDNPYANKVINYIAQRETLPTIDTTITEEQVSQGFRKWRESTSTSPSGCHLGIR
jgi:hypothetical protein